MDIEELIRRLLAGDRRALARALSHVEDGAERVLRDVIAQVHPHTGDTRLIGITGPPGAGKSTLTNTLVTEWRRRGATVAVLAIDPSSPFSGGALLGDRVRMQEHVLDEGVFVRSMASRGHLGGLSWATPHALLVLDAAGFDVVILETVGVGQAEVEVASVADTTVVVAAPGMGDAIQAAKAGILEIADVFCVNKADREGADRAVRELREMQKLGHGEWLAPICKTVAATGDGVVELTDAIEEHGAWLSAEHRLEPRRRRRAQLQIREIALAEVQSRFRALGDGQRLDALARQVAGRAMDPYTAADQLVAGLVA